MKYYAVAKGKVVGIFNEWDKVKPLVSGFSGAKYKSFKTLDCAQKYMLEYSDIQPSCVENPLYNSNDVTDDSESDSFDKCNDSEIVKTIYRKKYKENITTNEKEVDKITIYTDGSCIDKIGGYGYVVINNNNISPFCGKIDNQYNNREYNKYENKYVYNSTNQVAELYAIYKSIFHVINNFPSKIVKGIIIYTDSKYSIGCLNTWNEKWKLNGWKNSQGKNVKNRKLIEDILLISVGINIKYRHVKAHNGDEYNEMADRLANLGREQ